MEKHTKHFFVECILNTHLFMKIFLIWKPALGIPPPELMKSQCLIIYSISLNVAVGHKSKGNLGVQLH